MRPLPLIAVVFLLASCASIRLDPGRASAELTALMPEKPPIFTAVGRLTPDTGGNIKLLLAVAGDNFLLQALTTTGTAIFAAVGNLNQHEVINPHTGERLIRTGASANWIDLNGVRIPTVLLSSLVTGTPPQYNSLVEAEIDDKGSRLVRVSGPDMIFAYTTQLDSIRYESGAGDLTLLFGPRVREKDMSYVRQVHAEFGFAGKGAILRWERVEQRSRFEPGFFSFSDF